MLSFAHFSIEVFICEVYRVIFGIPERGAGCDFVKYDFEVLSGDFPLDVTLKTNRVI